MNRVQNRTRVGNINRVRVTTKPITANRNRFFGNVVHLPVGNGSHVVDVTTLLWNTSVCKTGFPLSARTRTTLPLITSSTSLNVKTISTWSMVVIRQSKSDPNRINPPDVQQTVHFVRPSCDGCSEAIKNSEIWFELYLEIGQATFLKLTFRFLFF